MGEKDRDELAALHGFGIESDTSSDENCDPDVSTSAHPGVEFECRIILTGRRGGIKEHGHNQYCNPFEYPDRDA